MWPEYSNITDAPLKEKLSYLQFIRQSENPIELDANSKRILTDSISKHLDSPLTRCEGLLQWLTAIQSSKLYLSNWGSLLEASLLLSKSSPSKKLALQIFNQQIITFKEEAQFVGSFLKFWPKVCKCLTEDFENNEVIFLSLQSIKIAMDNFPVLVGQSAPDIIEYILKNMDCESNVVAEALSDCFSLLPKLMTCQFAYHSAWQGFFDKATNTLELQIKDIITFNTGLNGSRDQLSREDCLQITCCATEGMPLLLHKVRVFISMSKCLTKLIWSYSPETEVHVENLLEVVKLVIYLTDQITPSVNSFHLIYFPKLCISSLLLLESIILSFHIVEHTDSILAMMLKILKNEKINNEPIYNREVRLATWKFLGVWIKQYGGSVSSKIISDKIVGELICDISMESENTDSEPPKLDTQICCQALKVLGGLIQTAVTFIDTKNLEFIINRVLERARHVQLNLHPLKTINQPYSNEDCRLELYNLLLDCCSYDHPFRENCMRRSIHIFKGALRDPSVEVITLGRRANNLFQNFLNPKKSPPDYALPYSKAQSSECQEGIIANWKAPSFEDSWQHEQLNGGAEPMEMQQGPPPMYQVEDDAYQQAVVDSENTQERPSDHESSPHYQDLQPVNQYNTLRTYSGGSSRSESMDNSVEEEILIDEENRHSQLSHKQKASNVPNRPNIQMLKAYSRMEECVDNETVVQDVQSDHDSMEEEDEVSQPKSFVAENGAADDSEEDEEAYDEDEAEEEYEEANEDRFSSEPEERPIKKFKKDQEIIMNPEDDGSSEEETANKNPIEIEDTGECRDVHENEEESKPEINGEKDESQTQTENDPTVDEMMSDLVVAEPDS